MLLRTNADELLAAVKAFEGFSVRRMLPSDLFAASQSSHRNMYLSTTTVFHNSLNPLECRGSHSAKSNNIKLVHWPLMGSLLHLVQRGEDWAGPKLAQAPPYCTKCNSPTPALYYDYY